jgi:Cyclic nucleotide-binding domain
VGVTARALGIHANEWRTTALVSALMCISMSVATIGESGINALFLDRVGAQALPLMYLAQAGASLVAMFALTTVLQRVAHRAVYIWSPLLLAAVVLTERAALLTGAPWIYSVLWVTVAFATLAQGIGLWGTAGAVVDTRQAKRLFPIFGAGGILGAVVGGLCTRPLAAAIGAENLLLVWVGGLIVAAWLCRLSLGSPSARDHVIGARRHGSLLHDVKSGLSYVRRSRLLVGMALAAVLFSVLFYSLFLPFATVATERFADADALAGFFGLVGASITGTAFVISILVTNRSFARFGVTTMVLVLPLLYLGAFGILLVASGFVTIVVLRVLTGVWLQGVASPAWETLVNVVPDDRRDETRAFLNGGPAQVGTAIAGVVALVGQDVLSARQFAAIGLVASLLTLAAALLIHHSYAEALLRALLAGRPQVFRKSTAWTPVPLDIGAQESDVLASAMRSDDTPVRRFAFQLAAELHVDVLSTKVLGGSHDADPIVRLAVVGALDLSTASGRAALLHLVDDPDPGVGAAASARAIGLRDGRATTRLTRLLADRDARVRRLAVEQLGAAPRAVAADLSERLLVDADAEVRAAALGCLSEVARDRALAPTLALLHDRDLGVRLAAGRVLGTTGERGVEHVLLALGDPGSAAAGIEAARHLDAGSRTEPVRAFVRTTAGRAEDDRVLIGAIPMETAAEDLLRAAILERGQGVARSGLWAASMLAPSRQAMHVAIDRLDAPGAVRASAIEALEAADTTKEIAPLLTLWEPISAAGRDDGWLRQTLQDEDGLIRSCAALVRARHEGDPMTRTLTTLSVIERVLILREIPLFSDLGPTDLEGVARIAEERGYGDGETIAREGELGDEMYVVTEGTIRVVQDLGGRDREIARRSAGDVVGEMSIITRNPRVASLVADGVVRTIRIGRREFESMVRERPDLAIAVMRVLALRLAESDGSAAPGGSSV